MSGDKNGGQERVWEVHVEDSGDPHNPKVCTEKFASKEAALARTLEMHREPGKHLRAISIVRPDDSEFKNTHDILMWCRQQKPA